MKKFDYNLFDINVGLELHVVLDTEKKLFSNMKRDEKLLNINKNIDFIDMAYPGTLPNLNKSAVKLALKSAKLFNCKLSENIVFDRKHYFYPDLPKGYQITQHRYPMGKEGNIEFNIDNEKLKLKIISINLEEDTGKSIHKNNSTYLNYSRAGQALIEIVTFPDINKLDDVEKFINYIRSCLLINNISKARMQFGELRCDVNVSIKKKKDRQMGVKTEIKNINSITNIKKAIEIEITRQYNCLINNNPIYESTWRFDDNLQKNVFMREKNTADNYFYLPEYDIPPIYIDKKLINELIVFDPIKIIEKYTTNIDKKEFNHILNSRSLFIFFLDTVNIGNIDVKKTLNLINGPIKKYLNENSKKIDETHLSPKKFNKLIKYLDKGKINNNFIKKFIEKMLKENSNLDSLLNEYSKNNIKKTVLIDIINVTIDNNKKLVSQYKSGNDKIINYFIGQIMKETKGNADIKEIEAILISKLK